MDREEETVTTGAAASSMTTHEQQKTKKRKRSFQEHDPLQLAYQNVNIVPRVSSGRPGSPHAFFKKSFDFSFKKEQQGLTNDEEKEETVHSGTNKEESSPANKSTIRSSSTPQQKEQEEEALCIGTQVVHQHANGLCIVTVGEDLSKMGEVVKEVNFLVKESNNNNMSAAARRKRGSKMLQGKIQSADMDGITTPSGILAQLKCSSGKTISIRGCVWGQVMELNHRLEATPELLHKDPLLDGHLAIVLPAGPFPPPTKVVQGTEKQQDEKKKVSKQKSEECFCSES